MSGEGGAPRPGPEKPPPLDEDPGKGQFYFPGRPKGCVLLLLLLALAAAGATAAAAGSFPP